MRSPSMKTWAAVALAIAAALPAPRALGEEAKDPPPSFLFILSDDQRPDTIAAHGNAHIRTPNLDRLAAEGYSFYRTYCMGSTHGAVCQPSRAMLQSGRTLYRVPMDLRGVKILPELLREKGYATFGTGKWHNGAASFLRGFEKGTAVFLGGMSDHLKVPVADVTPEGRLTAKREGEKFSSELFADAAIEFLRGRSGDRPFFAYIAFTAPHDPRQPPVKYREMYYRQRPPLPPNFLPQHPFNNGWMTGRDEALAPWPRTEEVIRDQLAEYYGMITHMDAQIGRVLAALEESGAASRTVVIFTADQGLAMGSHGLLGKQNLYERSLGAPLILAGPGIPRGASSRALAYLYDLYPTVCDIAGVKVPEGVEGQSLRPVWEGRKEAVRDSIFLTYENLMRSVRDDRWKLIRYPQIGHTQLFDLQTDPHETSNLAADPAHADRVKALWRLLEEWQRRTADTQPLTVSEPRPMEIDLTGRRRTPDAHQPEWIRKKYFAES